MEFNDVNFKKIKKNSSSEWRIQLNGKCWPNAFGWISVLYLCLFYFLLFYMVSVWHEFVKTFSISTVILPWNKSYSFCLMCGFKIMDTRSKHTEKTNRYKRWWFNMTRMLSSYKNFTWMKWNEEKKNMRRWRQSSIS